MSQVHTLTLLITGEEDELVTAFLANYTHDGLLRIEIKFTCPEYEALSIPLEVEIYELIFVTSTDIPVHGMIFLDSNAKDMDYDRNDKEEWFIVPFKDGTLVNMEISDMVANIVFML